MAQYSGEATYAGHSNSIELRGFSPMFLDDVCSLSDYFLPTVCGGVHIHGGALLQHADVPIREHKFWPTYAFLFQ